MSSDTKLSKPLFVNGNFNRLQSGAGIRAEIRMRASIVLMGLLFGHPEIRPEL